MDKIITIAAAGTVKSFNSTAALIYGYLRWELPEKNKMSMPEPDRPLHNEYISNYHLTDIG